MGNIFEVKFNSFISSYQQENSLFHLESSELSVQIINHKLRLNSSVKLFKGAKYEQQSLEWKKRRMNI